MKFALEMTLLRELYPPVRYFHNSLLEEAWNSWFFTTDPSFSVLQIVETKQIPEKLLLRRGIDQKFSSHTFPRSRTLEVIGVVAKSV